MTSGNGAWAAPMRLGHDRIPLISNGANDLECGSTTNNTARAKDVAFAVNHFDTGTTNMLVVRKYNEDKKLDIDIISAKDHADALLLVEGDRATAFAMDDFLLFGLKSNAKAPNDKPAT